jgi:hypothetical protein
MRDWPGTSVRNIFKEALADCQRQEMVAGAKVSECIMDSAQIDGSGFMISTLLCVDDLF